jgi:hypothetical protein
MVSGSLPGREKAERAPMRVALALRWNFRRWS